MSGIYVHIPYCSNKCLYCDFYSGGRRIAQWGKFTYALLNELNLRREEMTTPIDTLYFGGGTPSLIPEGCLYKLTDGIKYCTGVENWEEFTLEANPEDITSEKCRNWKKVGVNRVSLGVQSLNDNELKAIDRRHDSTKAREAIRQLKDTFENISVDVMFGLPGQTPDSYSRTLSEIIGLKPNHVSAYSLMLEPGTAMTHLVEQERVNLPAEEEWMEMFDLTGKMLEEEGYFKYEISNYALPGFESRHNSSYWMGKPYLGLGPGAHSYDGRNSRRYNPQDLKGYISRFGEQTGLKKVEPWYNEEVLSHEELIEERIMTRLRMSRGLNLKEFERDFGKQQKNDLLQKACRFIIGGLLKEKSGYLSFTPKGFYLSDTVLSALF